MPGGKKARFVWLRQYDIHSNIHTVSYRHLQSSINSSYAYVVVKIFLWFVKFQTSLSFVLNSFVSDYSNKSDTKENKN